MAGRLRRQLLERVPEPTLRRLDRLRHGEHPSPQVPIGHSVRNVTPQVVTSFDAHAVRAEVAATVLRAFDRAGIAHLRLPGPRDTVAQVAVAAEDRAAAVAALESALAGPGWVITPQGARRQRAGVLSAHRVLAAPGGQVLCGLDTACRIGFWPAITAAGRTHGDGEPLLPGTRTAPDRNGVAAHLSAQSWQRAADSPSRWLDDPRPGVFDVVEPIDLVVTWVDGDDPNWRARRAAHSDGDDARHTSAAHESRYTSRDELRFALRSVAMYASWIRRIHLVTDAQVPAWLDVEHPQIQVVDHRAIFPDQDALPVFNSHAIESRLHHVPGLAEHYLYLNDDMFFGRPVEPELFFHGNGIAKFFLARDPIDLDPPSEADLPVNAAAKNQRALIEDEFGRSVRGKFRHMAHPQLRSIADDMERRLPEEFARVARSRFRHPDDLSIPSSMQHFWAYAQGRAVPGDCTYMYQDIGRANMPRRLDEMLRRRPDAFCLNDMGTEELDPVLQQETMEMFLDQYFPLPAPWERAGVTWRAAR